VNYTTYEETQLSDQLILLVGYLFIIRFTPFGDLLSITMFVGLSAYLTLAFV